MIGNQMVEMMRQPNTEMYRIHPRVEVESLPHGDMKMTVQGVSFDNISGDLAIGRIDFFIMNRDSFSGSRQVFFVNVHSIHIAQSNRDFLSSIRNCDLTLPDGSGLKIAARLLGTSVVENLNGTDFLPRVLRVALKKGWTIYLFGARQDVIMRCERRLSEQFPGLRIIGSHPGFFDPHHEQAIISDINRCRPDILLVALGSPFQELWISQKAKTLDVGVSMAVGGLFDFISGAVPRAPEWMQRFGIEWLFRFGQAPLGKWRRVAIEIPIFLLRALIEANFKRQNSNTNQKMKEL